MYTIFVMYKLYNAIKITRYGGVRSSTCPHSAKQKICPDTCHGVLRRRVCVSGGALKDIYIPPTCPHNACHAIKGLVCSFLC